MVSTLHDHPITWTPPSPFWSDSDHADMQQPLLLRFASDDFMEEVQRILASDPEKLRGYAAVPETWRGIRTPARTANPAGGRAGILSRLGVAARRSSSPATERPSSSSDAAAMDLKLYQPAHQRYYLVGATLVCQQPGLPDRKIDAGKQEKVSFVIRRWFPPAATTETDLPAFDEATWTEHAFVAQADGKPAWVPVAAAGAEESDRAIVLPEEERLPLFPLSFTEDDTRTRRLLAGLVPVGKRDSYHAAMRLQDDGTTGAGGTTPNTARAVLFRKLVSEPWKALVEQARTAWLSQNNPSATEFDEPADADELKVMLREARSTLQLGSWLVLADFADYLKTYLPTVYAAVRDNTSSLAGHSGDVLKVLRQSDIGAALKTKLNPTPPPTVDVVATSMASALRTFIQDTSILQDLERTNTPYARPQSESTNPVTANPNYPPFLFPLADPENILDAARPDFSGVASVPAPPAEPSSGSLAGPDFDTYKTDIDKFAAIVIRALETVPNQPEPAVPAAADRPADMRDGWFHLRCVYERPACGPLHDDVVSTPSTRFKLAGFFDPDAPARPIRIGLPVDTTPAGLRKFDKNTAFVMSDILCGQVARMKGLTLGDLVRTVLPWPLHKDLSVPDNGPCKQGGPNIGLICSLSIPIITICALILLMIMVSLLDFVFRWMPYFIVCFPLPGLRAKKSGG